MKRLIAMALAWIAILLPLNVVFSDPSSKTETITGRVVAYANGLTCLNGNAYWSMLIHVQADVPESSSKFIQVRFSLPCRETPQWLNRKSPEQKFRLKREQDADSALKEFLDCAPDSVAKCPHAPIWRLVPGVDLKKLPFGKLVPSYGSVDLPVVPVV